nr:thermonuclease family protein [uncultured Albidiferax sp.]
MSATFAALICLVVGVSDGDTLKVRCGEPGAYEQIKVRLAEIDAPESRQPYGDRSRQALADLCFKVDAVVSPQKKDRYGRTVARVACNGIDASANQVRVGMAWAYTKYLTDPRIQQLETDARARGLGLWDDISPVPPWAWRAGTGSATKQTLEK